METAIAIADRHDITLGIEPELANVVNSAAKAAQLLAELKTPRLKIILDAANLFEMSSLDEQRRVVSSAIDLLAQHITMAHAKDRSSTGEFVTAGTGVLDYEHYLTCLKRIGFAGPLITHGLSEAEAPATARFLHQALAKAGIAAR